MSASKWQAEVLRITTSSGATVTKTLERDRSYLLVHTGYDKDNNPSGARIYYGTQVAPTASAAAGTDKDWLEAGQQIEIGPGLAALYALTSAGEAQLRVVPGPYYEGRGYGGN